MSYIEERDIAWSIVQMTKAGKIIPAHQREGKSAQQVLKEMAAFWYGIFAPKKIGKERWQAATRIALTLSGVYGLNSREITPALMEQALRYEESDRLLKKATEYRQEKTEEAKPFAPERKWIIQTFLSWFMCRLKAGHKTSQFKPTPEEVTAFGRKLGLTSTEIADQKLLLMAYLSDKKYAAATGAKLSPVLYLSPERRVTLGVNAV